MTRRVAAGVGLAVLGIAGTGAWLYHASGIARERELLRHAGAGLAFADSVERSLSVRRAGDISNGEALAALYLVRLRLGMGSPFRLVEQLLRDPAIKPVEAERLAEAMLARTMIGDVYLPRTASLDLASVRPVPGLGVRHQALIDSVVAAFENPRVGELTVRLAYRLATVSGALGGRAPEIATAAAALARDRILAMRDARRLLAAADQRGLGRVAMLRAWREQRRFLVEQPVLLPLAAREERDAVAGLPSLVTLLESLTSPESGDLMDVRSPEERRIGESLAARMASVAAQRDLPPLAPVTVSVRGYSSLLLSGRSGVRPERERFVRRASGEETLAAEYALLSAKVNGSLPAADATVLTAAVALRQFAQDRGWVPGETGPTARDLQSRLGIAVTWDSTARAAWRPFLHRALEAAVVDMKRVFPGFDPRGLRVHFGASPLGERALAMHDPLRRTIYFPPNSSSGVMAHEFAHDLDWQAARREFGGPGWYRTDHALRRPSDRLAGALRRMASATPDDPIGGPRGQMARPTEIMARNVDWFVSAQLAREGRMNGFLSAAQDPVLTGFASAITPEAARGGGEATLRALDGLTTLPLPASTWFSSLYGGEREMTVHEAVRRVLEAPAGRVWFGPRRVLGATWSAGGTASAAAWSCLMSAFTARAADPAAVRAAVQYAAESRARGALRQWADHGRPRPESPLWRLRALTGPPWEPSLAAETHREVRDRILLNALMPQAGSPDAAWAVRTSGCAAGH